MCSGSRTIAGAFMDGMTPLVLPVEPENIPAELQALRQWVCWRYEENEQGKLTKVPYDPRGERPASSTDQATWGEFADVLRTYFLGDCGIDGIGLVLTPSDGFVGIDLDHCVNDAKILTWALKIIFELESYSEFSPSGSGVRIFLDGKLPPGGRKRGSVEMYESGRYFTVAGQHYPKSPGT